MILHEQKTHPVLRIFFIAALAAPYSAFPGEYYMPTRENQRPLSGPPQSLRLDLGFDIAMGESDRGPGLEMSFMTDLTGLTLPYVKLGERCEISGYPLIKYYFLKNTEIRDSCAVISGPNFAVYAGPTSLEYSTYGGYNMSFGAGHQYKMPVSGKSWIFSWTIADIDLLRHLSANVTMGMGWQLTDKWFIRTSAEGMFHQWRDYWENTQTNEKFHADYSLWTLMVPVDAGVNFSARNSVLLRTGYYWRKGDWYPDFYGVLMGFQYSHTWYWGKKAVIVTASKKADQP